MKKQIKLRHFLVFILLTSVMAACQKEKHEQMVSEETELSISEEPIVVPVETETLSTSINAAKHSIGCNTFYGPEVKMGNGHLRSWINISRKDGKPTAIGIEFTDKSFYNLPTDHENFAANTFVLKLHQKAKAITPFDHITVNWEPEGHEPPGIYDVPHFDLHFYKISIAEQMAIGPVPGPIPPAGYLPASYVIQGATVPQMGTHWLDPASPELPPTLAPFTHTFIYGSSNGKVIFLEPMITRAFFLTPGASATKSIPQPILFAPTGTHYPSTYKIWKNADNKRHYVALTDFVLR
jgi:Domain of unknown function (DUF5602)